MIERNCNFLYANASASIYFYLKNRFSKAFIYNPINLFKLKRITVCIKSKTISYTIFFSFICLFIYRCPRHIVLPYLHNLQQRFDYYKFKSKNKFNLLFTDFFYFYRRKTRLELIRVSAAVMGIEFSYAAETGLL